jgi:membrane associated rhomboid family serine protease
VAGGDWWRLVTSMFLHGFILHIVFNMVALWYIGGPVEQYLGRLRFVLLYFVSGLAGSAGALVSSPHGFTVGASGAIFGVLGAMLILEWNATGKFGGAAASMIAINLVFNFAYNGAGGNISIGGHIGGLIGGILVTLTYANFGRGHAAYGRLGPRSIIGLAAVAVASVLVAYLEVHGRL